MLRGSDPHGPVYEVFQRRDLNGEWSYRVRRGGRITSSAGEGYASKYNAKRAAYALAAQTEGARVVVVHTVDATQHVDP